MTGSIVDANAYKQLYFTKGDDWSRDVGVLQDAQAQQGKTLITCHADLGVEMLATLLVWCQGYRARDAVDQLTYILSLQHFPGTIHNRRVSPPLPQAAS